MVAEPVTMAAPAVAPKLWTYDEIQATFDDDVRRELYDGEIFEMPAPYWIHQRILRILSRILDTWTLEHGGELFFAPVDLYVSARRYFEPDLLFYTAQSLEEKPVFDDPAKFRVAPDLIVEVISPGTARNDRVRKLRIYAEFGVQHYWLLDPENRSLEVLELRDGIYAITHALAEDESFQPTLFPGLTLSLNEIFAQ